MSKIKDKLNLFKDRLTKINDEEPLSKLSLFVIIALDIFILTIVFQGLDDHTHQLTSPKEYVTYECRQALIKKNWTDEDRISKLQPLVLIDHGDYAYRRDSLFSRNNIEQMHPISRDFYKKIEIISKNKVLIRLFKNRAEQLRGKTNFTEKFKKSKDVYDTSLLENLAAERTDKLETISDAMKSKAQRIEAYNAQIKKIDKEINANLLIKDLWAFISANHKDTLLKDLKTFEFWYPFKELAWQFLFLLPLFIVFYIWNMGSVKKDNKLQALISTHLLVIAAIPILFKIIEVILDFIPHHFLDDLFDILEALNIIALWHYFVIVGSIGAALFTIYIIQKKIFNKRRLELKRLMKGACYNCGKKLPRDPAACPFCGKMQYKKCASCNNEMFIVGAYCNSCGEKRLND